LLKPIVGKDGFTLVELLIVLSILAVLAGVVVLSLSMYVSRGHEEACNVDQRSLQSAVIDYLYANDGSWPTEDGSKPGDIFYGDPVTGPLVGDYINEVPDSDINCDWQIDGQGIVVTNTPDDCPCD